MQRRITEPNGREQRRNLRGHLPITVLHPQTAVHGFRLRRLWPREPLRVQRGRTVYRRRQLRHDMLRSENVAPSQCVLPHVVVCQILPGVINAIAESVPQAQCMCSIRERLPRTSRSVDSAMEWRHFLVHQYMCSMSFPQPRVPCPTTSPTTSLETPHASPGRSCSPLASMLFQALYGLRVTQDCFVMPGSAMVQALLHGPVKLESQLTLLYIRRYPLGV